jgi:cyclopropane fatty-acyl-phospholipid synthase-like methyltransferase
VGHRVCPWWLGYWLINPLRTWVESPARLLAPLLREGMVVLEPGCGMGYFTLEAARLVGPGGRVVALDLQPRMLAVVEKRARRAGLAERIETRLTAPRRLDLADMTGRADFAMAIHVVHELPDEAAFFAELRAALKPGAGLLLVEPRGHVSADEFAATVAVAEREGFACDPTRTVALERSALMRRLP